MRAGEPGPAAAPGPGGARLIRKLREDDDLEPELDLRQRAFGPIGPAERAHWREAARLSVQGGRLFGVFDGSALVGTARFHDMRQWWHGRSLPMAGVAGVKIAPEQRGRGLGKALMSQLLTVIADRGYPLSVLFPSTSPIYRSLGWEMAGGLYETVLPARSLSPLVPADTGRPEPLPALRRAGPDDAAEVIAVASRVHGGARECGPNTRDAASVRLWLSDPSMFAYLAPDGFLAYGWHRGSKEIMVQQALAGSAAAARAIWGIVASHASMADTVRAFLGPQDPVGWLTGEPDVEIIRRDAWMLRVVDAPAAIAARGFPAAAQLSVTLLLDDAMLPANSGWWTLDVEGGQATFTRRETERGAQLPPAPRVRLGARGFAALYAGTPLATLRHAGLAADGDPDTVAALDCAFASTPFMVDHF